MNVYIWERIDRASDRYHSEGGLVVFADNIQRAIELANLKGAFPTAEELPNTIRECDGQEDAFVFPDAGCC